MSRIILPTTALGWQLLIKGIKAKHVADGAASPLNVFHTENGFDIDAIEAKAVSAVAHEAIFFPAGLNAEENFAERNKLFNPVFKIVKKIAQFLKKLFANNVAKVGEWGVTINGNKIAYPNGFLPKKQLFDRINTKHTTFAPPPSPLVGFLTENLINMAQSKTDADAAEVQNTSGTANKNLKEQEKELRENDLKDVKNYGKKATQYLKKHHESSPKKLGQYTIRVDDSPRGSRRRKSKINPGAQKTATGCLIGGLFINDGFTELNIFKGKLAQGTPIVLRPGEQFGILEGYSTITVVNTSATVKGSYSFDINL